MSFSTLVRRPGVWIAVGIVVVAGVAVLLRARGPLVHTTRPVRSDLEQHIVASGRVRVPTRVQHSAQTSGLVVAVGAVEGQHVAAGDLLVQIDDAAQRASVAQAEAVVNQAKARVDQLRRVGAIVATEALRQTESTLSRAKTDLDRTTKLVNSRAVPAEELENAQRAFDIAHAQRTAAEAQQISASPMGADSRIALTTLLQAQAQLAGANAQLAQTRIVARERGTVLNRSVEPGDVVQPGRTLLVMAVDADAQLVFEIDERNLAWIKLGQKARVSADAYPQQVFDAVVSYIAPSIDPQRGNVEIRLAVPVAPPFLKPDMTVSVDLTAAAKQGVLTIASDAVHGAATPSPYVLTVEDGHVVRHEIGLGIRGDGSVELTSGVAESAEVIVPDGRVLASGARVRMEH